MEERDGMESGRNRRILTPSQLNAEAQVVLEEQFGVVWIEGELSNLARPASGHWYFTLKDRKAQVRCAMFKGRNARVKFEPENGMQVLLRARVSLYAGRGEFQLVVDAIEPAGEGALRLAFDQLRKRLEGEGLFAAERKRPIPESPVGIAVITSPSGAALRDILTVLRRRWPLARVTLVSTSVQGDAATSEIVGAFRRLGRWLEAQPEHAPEVVIAGRGGGSLEDLWCFNEEAVARAIADCTIPVISAVGHETDFTIADFVADLRAPTPSAAAELATPDQSDLASRLRNHARAMTLALRRRIDLDRSAVARASQRMQDPSRRIDERSQRIDELALRLERRSTAEIQRKRERLATIRARLERADPRRTLEDSARQIGNLEIRLRRSLPDFEQGRQGASRLGRRLARAQHALSTQKQQQLAQTVARLDALNPLAVLQRGYAILEDAASATRPAPVIRDAQDVEVGQALRARLATGSLDVEVIASHTPETPPEED